MLKSFFRYIVISLQWLRIEVCRENGEAIAERLSAKLPVIRFAAAADRSVEGQVEEIIDLLVERHVLPESAADGFII